MNAVLSAVNRSELRSWAISGASACGLTLAILFLLVFAHRVQVPVLPTSDGVGIHLETVMDPEDSGAPAGMMTSPEIRTLPPPASPVAITPLTMQNPPVDVSVDLSRMLAWRYGYDDLGGSGFQEGSFGISNFSEVDQSIESLVIPPRLFPDTLIDAGITEGRVVVKLLIDEKGHAEVKTVLSSTHPALVPPVVEAMGRALYSIPIRNGRPTKSIVNRTVVFTADPEHVAKRRSMTKP
ncbi:MAG: energy transducer TonB [Opitutaceae bacterium]